MALKGLKTQVRSPLKGGLFAVCSGLTVISVVFPRRLSRNSTPWWRCTGSRSYPSGRSPPTVRLCGRRCTTHAPKAAPWPGPLTRTSPSSLCQGEKEAKSGSSVVFLLLLKDFGSIASPETCQRCISVCFFNLLIPDQTKNTVWQKKMPQISHNDRNNKNKVSRQSYQVTDSKTAEQA